MRLIFAFLLLAHATLAAGPEFPLTDDSRPQANVAKGTMIKETHTAKPDSVFPGTQREYQIYLPAGHDASKASAFMVFQDGVLYQAPVVFDNLIAKKDIPPLVGIFIKPGVVPAANENALPRFNRSFEYDSVTPRYSDFLIEEFLPAIEVKHKLKLSRDPNHAAVSGSSSGGICAFMVGWHRPDRFRRVFTSVGTYVGIHGADQLPVWIRKHAPKPLRVFLQSGTHDGNGYCGDWWMANQTMERSLVWAGYEVNHAWGEGGHDQKHASQVFPDVLRWLWKDWQTNIEVKANAKDEGKWRGYEVVGAGDWEKVYEVPALENRPLTDGEEGHDMHRCDADASGTVYAYGYASRWLIRIGETVTKQKFEHAIGSLAPISGTKALRCEQQENGEWMIKQEPGQKDALLFSDHVALVVGHDSRLFMSRGRSLSTTVVKEGRAELGGYLRTPGSNHWMPDANALCFSPDQTQLYLLGNGHMNISVAQVTPEGLEHGQHFATLDAPATGLCVDRNGWLYASTYDGIQVCDQAGRMNFVIPTPQEPEDVCFGGKDLGELFIVCGNAVYKRPTKAKGVVSGQQAPIKPAAPKL